MILGQISYLDCVVFLIFLAPRLLFDVNIFLLFFCVSKALPFFRKASCPVAYVSANHMLMFLSFSITIRIYFGKIFYSKKESITFRHTSFTIPRRHHQMRTLCIRIFPSQHRSGLFLQGGRSAVLSVSNAPARLQKFANPMAREKASKRSWNLDNP